MWDISGQVGNRKHWSSYCRTTDALVYMVDLADAGRLQASSEAFSALLQDPTVPRIPVLLLGNKADLTEAITLDALRRLLYGSQTVLSPLHLHAPPFFSKHLHRLDSVRSAPSCFCVWTLMNVVAPPLLGSNPYPILHLLICMMVWVEFVRWPFCSSSNVDELVRTTGSAITMYRISVTQQIQLQEVVSWLVAHKRTSQSETSAN